MIKVVRLVEHCQAVMDTVTARHAAILEPEATKKGVRFDDILDRLSQRSALDSIFGRDRVTHENVVAGSRQRQTRDGRRKAGGDVVLRAGLHIGARFEPS